MKLRVLLLSILSVVFVAAPVFAQTAPDTKSDEGVGNIINEIYQGHIPGQKQNQSQIGQNLSLIDNIPVQVHYDAGRNGLPQNARLIISAFAPPPPNIRRSSPLMIGETQILLTGLEAPLQLVIAAPQPVTNDIDYARIEAKIVDTNGNAIFELRNSAEYRGYDAAVLRLNRIGEAVPTLPVEPIIEAVHGTVSLSGDAPAFQGANLVVRLIEEGLAGGSSRMIIADTRVSLDQKQAPFAFAFERGVNPSIANTPLVFEAWIEDWAGRKTHTLPRPISYNGTTHAYQLQLGDVAVESTLPTSPNPITPAPPSYPDVNAEITVQGEAKFDAFKGLPSGSVLIAELTRGQSGVFAQSRVKLDGLSGDVRFDISTIESLLNSNLPIPRLNVRIEDQSGKLFFSNAGGALLQHGMNSVNLVPSAGY